MAKGDIKNRREVERLSASLPAGMTERQRLEATRASGTAWLGKKKGWCDVCANEFEHDLWDSRRKTMRCPVCGARVDVKKSPRKYVSNNRYYFQAVTTCEGWQVIRTWHVDRKAQRRMVFGTEELRPMSVEMYAVEVYQRWIKPKTTPVIIGLAVHGASCYCDIWNWTSEWKLRREGYQHCLGAWMESRPRLLPELKMRGLTRLSDNCSASEQIEKVFNAWEAEVLLKAGERQLYDFFIGHSRRMRDCWPSIRVALRHHYKIKDVTMWIDLVEMLQKNGKDVHNPHYVCPVDLKAAHDEQMDIIRRRQERERAEREAEERRRHAELMNEDGKSNMKYREKMGRMLGVTVKVGDLELKPLQSIREFFDEGEAMHHCVFSNKYYSKADCLIVGARIKGERMETIEVNMKDWKIVQCRGKHNQSSKHHEMIMEAMTANMNKFRRMAQ